MSVLTPPPPPRPSSALQCKTCAQVAPRCDKCSSSGQCLKCQAGNFKDNNGMVRRRSPFRSCPWKPSRLSLPCYHQSAAERVYPLARPLLPALQCKKCASVNPNCLKCVDGSSGACSQCSGGYTLNSSKKCVKKKTCQDLFGANCAYCSPNLGRCLACRVGYYYDSQARECLSCKVTFGRRCSFCSARSCYWG